VSAWINAHCYLPKAGAKHICSEQVSLYITGKARTVLANLLFSQLDSDLPLTLWWRVGKFDHVDPEIWRWVDRLVFDSQAWAHPREQLSVMRRQLGTHRTALCDLSWTRTLHLRQSLAQMFDTGHAAALAKLRRIRVTHAPGARTSAVLLLGWFAAQLGWYAHGPGGNHVRFSGDGGDVLCDLNEESGACIGRVEIECDSLAVIATRRAENSFLHITVREGSGAAAEHVMPADGDDLPSLLDEELASGGRHRVYLKALAAAEPLL
jgi:glucose-6-phosphate dehydrogenase assembly protein OpcA